MAKHKQRQEVSSAPIHIAPEVNQDTIEKDQRAASLQVIPPKPDKLFVFQGMGGHQFKVNGKPHIVKFSEHNDYKVKISDPDLAAYMIKCGFKEVAE